MKNTQILGYDDLQKLSKRLKWQRKALFYLLVLLIFAGAYLYAYKVTESFWMKNLVVSYSPLVHKAQAKDITTEEYIKLVFGKEGDMAVAVAKAESHLRCDAQNVNKGTNSLDIGVFQINSVHLKKGIKVKSLLDCKENVDTAFEIWKGSGWSAWSVYKNKSYKKYL